MLLQLLKNLVFFVVIVESVFVNLGAADVGEFEECLAPDNQTGICVRFGHCQSLYQLILGNVTSKGKKFLSDSQCGTDLNSTSAAERVLVCCMWNDVVEDKIPGYILPKPPQCGKHFANRIYGGMKADTLEYPWMALIRYVKPSGSFTINCAGTLINHRYVLTAAHCLKNPSVPSSLQVHSVRFGEYNIETEPDCSAVNNETSQCLPPHVDIEVEELIIHELYDTTSLNQFYDIALIRLKQQVQFTLYISPICLPLEEAIQKNEFVNEPMEIAGWGSTEHSYQSAIKLKAAIRVFNRTKCQENFKSFDMCVDNTQLCAGGENSIDTCRGDSGGPLMVMNKNVYYVAGIVSYGPKPCGLEGWPGVYTRVGSYVSWILQNMKA